MKHDEVEKIEDAYQLMQSSWLPELSKAVVVVVVFIEKKGNNCLRLNAWDKLTLMSKAILR